MKFTVQKYMYYLLYLSMVLLPFGHFHVFGYQNILAARYLMAALIFPFLFIAGWKIKHTKLILYVLIFSTYYLISSIYHGNFSLSLILSFIFCPLLALAVYFQKIQHLKKISFAFIIAATLTPS